MSQVHLTKAMTNVSIAYRNENYIGTQVFPIVSVQKQSDKYFTFTKSDWFRNEAGMRAPGTVGPIVEYGLSSATYACQPIAAAKVVPDEIVDNADAPLRPMQEATEFATDKVMLYAEKEIADNVFGDSVWSGSANPTTTWDDDSSDPLGDVDVARETVLKTIGREPNVMVIGREVWTDLKNHPDLLDRIKYSNFNGIITPQVMSGLFQIKVLIGTAIYDSGAEGGTASYGYIWGKNAWIGYVAPSAGLMTPAAGYLFTWKNRTVESFRMDKEKATLVRVEWHYDDKVTSADAGYLYKSVVA